MRGAYYNEFNPEAAAWLRELIAAGLLPDGIVDERSIEEVQGGDLLGFTQVHLFASIGGWPYALCLAACRVVGRSAGVDRFAPLPTVLERWATGRIQG